MWRQHNYWKRMQKIQIYSNYQVQTIFMTLTDIYVMSFTHFQLLKNVHGLFERLEKNIQRWIS